MSITYSPPSYDASLFEDYSKAYNPYSTPVASTNTSRVGYTLYMSNLPSQTRPQHLGKIFAEPYPKGGKRGRERDAGITMIEIYTIPRVESSQSAIPDTENEPTTTAIAKSSASNSNKWSLSSSLKRAIIKSSSGQIAGTAAATASTQLRSVRSNSSGSSLSSSNSTTTAIHASRSESIPATIPTLATTTTTTTTGESTIHVQGVEDDEPQEEQEETRTRTSVDTLDNEDKITIAYVHFESDNHLQRAKHTLSEITIGGREISYETIGQTKPQQRIASTVICDNTNTKGNVDDITRVNVNVNINSNVGKRMWAWWTRENQISHDLTA